MQNYQTHEKFLARPPISLGDSELLAGVDDRNEFWKSIIPAFRESTETGMIAWRKKIKAAIKRRVRAGELTLLYPH